MKKYDSYKDSGVKWIGKIPTHWNCLPLKRGFTINNGKDYKDIQAEEGYPVIGSGGQFAYATDFLYSGEALLLGRKGTIDKPMYINDKFWTVDTMFYAVPNKSVCCKYMFYQAQTIPFGFYSTNTAVPSMTQTDLASNPMCFPPLAEQEAISEYLDEKCGKIDALIEAKEKQITDMLDYRRAIISETVTRGLNPNAPLKDSGVDWIKEIPEGWKCNRIKYMFSFGRGLSITKADLVDKGTPVISYGQIHSKLNTGTNISNELLRFVPNDIACTHEECKVSNGDFIFADTSEDMEGCGNCVYIDRDDIYAGYHSLVLKGRGRNNKFFAYLFKSDEWRSQIRSKVGGVKVFSITQNIMSNCSVIFPPLDEQEAIAAYLDEKTAKIDAVVEQLQGQIADLKDLKAATISDAVTGKVDVRDWK